MSLETQPQWKTILIEVILIIRIVSIQSQVKILETENIPLLKHATVIENFLPQEIKSAIKISVEKPGSLNKKRDLKESKEWSQKKAQREGDKRRGKIQSIIMPKIKSDRFFN